MNEQVIHYALTDIVNAVVKWQLEGADPNKIHRAEILEAARKYARASGGGFWLEAAEVRPDRRLEWYPVCWYESSVEADEAMKERHEFKKGTECHRVVNENDVVASRMSGLKKVG